LRFLKINEGQITIISGDGKVQWRCAERKTKNQTMHHPFQGTIIDMKINYDREGLYCLSDETEDVWEDL